MFGCLPFCQEQFIGGYHTSFWGQQDPQFTLQVVPKLLEASLESIAWGLYTGSLTHGEVPEWEGRGS